VFESSEQVHHALSEVGYLTDSVTATAVYLAAKLKKPLAVGGAGRKRQDGTFLRGGACSRYAGRTLQCYEGITEDKAIGKFDESLQRLYVEKAARSPEAADWGRAWQATFRLGILCRRSAVEGFAVAKPLRAADR